VDRARRGQFLSLNSWTEGKVLPLKRLWLRFGGDSQMLLTDP
jgi:hypothetical protein